MNIDFKDEAHKIKNNLIKIRRQIHQNPELGFCEFETAKLIKTNASEHNLKDVIIYLD